MLWTEGPSSQRVWHNAFENICIDLTNLYGKCHKFIYFVFLIIPILPHHSMRDVIALDFIGIQCLFGGMYWCEFVGPERFYSLDHAKWF